jgi:hypothetical protein
MTRFTAQGYRERPDRARRRRLRVRYNTRMDQNPCEPSQEQTRPDMDRLPPLANAPLLTMFVLLIVLPLITILLLLLGWWP